MAIPNGGQSTIVCTNCDKTVPGPNIELHQAHCTKNFQRCKLCGQLIPKLRILTSGGCHGCRRQITGHDQGISRALNGTRREREPRRRRDIAHAGSQKGLLVTVALAGAAAVLLSSVLFSRNDDDHQLLKYS